VAALVFTFQRASDTEAILTGAGPVGLQALYPTGANIGTYSQLELRNTLVPSGLTSIANGAVTQMSGDFNFGGTIPGWVVDDGDMLASPSRFFENSDSPTGTSFLEVTGGPIEWSPVGTQGEVWATYQAFEGGGGPREVLIGTWQMTAAVPEPG